MTSTTAPTFVGSDISVTVSRQHRIGYRPNPKWHVAVAGEFSVEPPTVRDWAEKYRERVKVMLRAMVTHGARELADEWMADFETCFCKTPESWTDAFRVANEADSAQNVAAAELLIERTPEAKRHYAARLRQEISLKLDELRALEVTE